MSDGPTKLKPFGPGRWIGMTPDGKYVVRHACDVSKTLAIQAERRKEAEHNKHAPKNLSGGRDLASIPPLVHAVMQQTCGGDPDKKKAWLRDHPWYLSVPKKQANLPPKRTYFLPPK